MKYKKIMIISLVILLIVSLSYLTIQNQYALSNQLMNQRATTWYNGPKALITELEKSETLDIQVIYQLYLNFSLMKDIENEDNYEGLSSESLGVNAFYHKTHDVFSKYYNAVRTGDKKAIAYKNELIKGLNLMVNTYIIASHDILYENPRNQLRFDPFLTTPQKIDKSFYKALLSIR